MASRGNTNKSQNRGSVKKKSTLNNQVAEEDNFSKANNEYGKGLSEAEVEIEHLKTTIIALNEKAEVLLLKL